MSPVLYKGRPYYEWMGRVYELRESDRDDEALSLLHGLIDAAEEDARREQSFPAPAYASLAAAMLQDRDEYDAAVEILERYKRSTEAAGFQLTPRMASELRMARRLASEGPVVENTTVCPACGAPIDPPIKRSGKCNTCRVRVLGRKYRGVTVLRTEEQQQAFLDLEERKDRLERTFQRANTIGVSDAEFEERWRLLNEKYGHPASSGDVFWSASTEKLHEKSTGPTAFGDLATINRIRAEHLFDEGRDWTRSAKEAARYALKELTHRPQAVSHVIVRGCACGPCTGQIESVTLEQAQAAEVLPHTDCENPPCPCSYYQA
jgi:hypothetical protein